MVGGLTKRLILPIPPPHEKQRKIESSTSNRIVVAAGRRFGKTTMVARMAAYDANAGKRVLYAAPIIAQTSAFWDTLMAWLKPAVELGLVYVHETKKLIRFNRSGGTIIAKTASLPDNLRGDFADLLVLDEYAYQEPDVWSKVCQPMLLDTGGRAIFISTANHRNHFYLMAQQAQENRDWAFFSAPSTSNPFLDADALKQLATDMTPEAYRQEILGEFVEGLGRVFQLSPALFVDPPQDFSAHRGHRAIAGLDWGLTVDYTAMSVGCMECKQELMLLRLKGGSYPLQIDEIGRQLTRFTSAGMELEILAEENAMGRANIEAMRELGWQVTPFQMSNVLKAELVTALKLVLEQGTWKWVRDVVGWSELEAFEGRTTRGGNVIYGTHYPGHDDTVIGRMLMLKQSQTGRMILV